MNRILASLLALGIMAGIMGSLFIGTGKFSSYAQEPIQTPGIIECPVPEDYLDNVFNDLTTVGEEIGAVDTTDPAAISLKYVEVYQLRHRYENMTPNLPECALRGHALFTNMLSNWEDILGLAMATHANPEASEQYISEIDVINERIEFFTPLLLQEFFPPQMPTPQAPTPTEVTILSTFYVTTEGLNVRSGPGPEYDPIGIVTGGTPLDVIALDTLDNGDVWYQVVYPQSETGTGWVFGPLISPERPEEFPEPLPLEELPTVTPTPNGDE